jgi:Fe-S cluster biogenesis protein NfuA
VKCEKWDSGDMVWIASEVNNSLGGMCRGLPSVQKTLKPKIGKKLVK